MSREVKFANLHNLQWGKNLCVKLAPFPSLSRGPHQSPSRSAFRYVPFSFCSLLSDRVQNPSHTNYERLTIFHRRLNVVGGGEVSGMFHMGKHRRMEHGFKEA